MWLTFAPSGGWCEALWWNGQSAEREFVMKDAQQKQAL
jgi:hypothetical protein